MPDTEFREEHIASILRAFYDRVRLDPLLAPVFSEVVEDWDEHLRRLGDFWSSLMLTSGRYKGNPVALHMIHAGRIEPAMFRRWLELWQLTTDEMAPGGVAADMQAKAARIAERLNSAMHGPESFIPARWPSDIKLAPYRSTKTFDQDTVPAALLVRHETKPGTWAVIRVVAGSMLLHIQIGASPLALSPDRPGLIHPFQPHHLELSGPVRFHIDFFDQDPSSLITLHR